MSHLKKLIDSSALVDFAAWLPHSTFTDPEEAADWWLANVHKSQGDKLYEARRYGNVSTASADDEQISVELLLKAREHPDGQYIVLSWTPDPSNVGSFVNMGASGNIDRLPGVLLLYATDWGQYPKVNKFIQYLFGICRAAQSAITVKMQHRAQNN